jgi:hypothetical protein
MRIYIPCLLLSLLLMAALAGCVRTTLPVREAVAVGSRTHVVTDRFGVCWPGDFDRSAIPNPVPPADAGEFIGGYNNHVKRGQSCHEQQSHIYSGGVRFDLSDLNNRVVESAHLSIQRRNTPVDIHVERAVPSGTVVENQCALAVEIATADWAPGADRGELPSRPIPVRWPLTLSQSGATIGAGGGVTWVVQQWALGRLPNYGFVIKPQAADIAKNENSCTGYWFDARLEITVLEREPD